MLWQSTAALLFALGDLAAGGASLALRPLFSAAPWLLVMYPPLLQVRGVINGVLCGRLTTSLHTGLVYPRIRGNTEYFWASIASAFSSTFIGCLLIAGVTATNVRLTLGCSLRDIQLIAATSLATGLLSVGLTIPATVVLATQTFRRGWNPDIFTYPVMSILADVAATACYAAVARAIVSSSRPLLAFELVFAACFASFIATLAAMRGRGEYFRMLKENIQVAIPLVLLGNVTGRVLAELRSQIEAKPGILLVYPSVTGTLGGAGSILGSMASTALVLGYVPPTAAVVAYSLPELAAVELASLLAYSIYGSIAALSSGCWSMLPAVLSVNLMGFPLIASASYLTAILTFRRGWDPDAYINPAVSSLADMVATLSLAAGLRAFS
ncbi:MAG: hypothetical protein DRN96_05820 [Thermoproteota archaeon]|nr:MAG: hypothetical protein DRN96_05820 [Candidatus Korarchaeota archaeon]